jgi:CRP/FNR family transcriptional regulator, anaerobic regulatory protein
MSFNKDMSATAKLRSSLPSSLSANMPKPRKKPHSKAPAFTPCTKCPLRKLEVFRNFTEEELAFIGTFKSGELALDAGNTIFTEGTNSPYLFTVLSGWAFKYKTLEDGRRQVLNFAMPGDLIGLQASIFDAITHSLEALTDVVLCVFPREKLWSLYNKHAGLAFDVTWLGAREESILGEYLMTVGQRRANERVAFVLLHLFRRARQLGLARGNTISLPMTQELLADTIGFSLVHTNKTLKQLRKSGAFKWTGSSFELLDEEKLADLVGPMAGVSGNRPFL